MQFSSNKLLIQQNSKQLKGKSKQGDEKKIEMKMIFEKKKVFFLCHGFYFNKIFLAESFSSSFKRTMEI